MIDFTVASAEAVMIVGSKLYGSRHWPIIYRCILAPNGLCIVRVPPKKPFIFICLTRFCDTSGHKDAPISRPVLSGSVCIVKTSDKQVCMRMVTQVQAVLQFLGLQVSFKRFIWTPATWEVVPLISHKAGRQAGGLHVPAWQPGVVDQGRGSLRV